MTLHKMGKKAYLIIIVISFAAGATAALLALGAERYFSSTAFCVKCHAMSYPYEGLKRSIHFGKKGFRPECGDCHLPTEPLPRAVAHATEGIKDIISSLRLDLSTKEAFEKHREEFEEKARANIRLWNGSPCKGCHKDPQPASAVGRSAHGSMIKDKTACVDCHRGIFHVD